ncbi:MAG: sigma-70 family RNA polymerase sigma factor [Pseudomonadota bacterium]
MTHDKQGSDLADDRDAGAAAPGDGGACDGAGGGDTALPASPGNSRRGDTRRAPDLGRTASCGTVTQPSAAAPASPAIVPTTVPAPVDPASDSDEALLALIAAEGSRAAFVVLFDRYAGKVTAFLMRAGATRDEAEEAAQEVMVTLWRQARQFNAARGGASTWIYTIARNKRIDMIRRHRRPEPDPNDPFFVPDPAESAERGVAHGQRDTRVRSALATLSEEQLAVVRLSFFAGLSQSEIAERLGTPLGTVKSRLRLSFRRLRETLGEEFQGELLDE